MNRGSSALVALIVLLSSGCATVVAGSPTAVGKGGGGEGGQQQPTVPEGPPDRDLRAVTAALRELDACKLFDKSRSEGVKVTAVPTGPHSCLLYPGDDHILNDGMRLEVGADSDQLARFSARPVTIGGFKGYWTHDGDGGESCRVTLPVSHTRAIEMTYRLDGEEDVCDIVLDYAEGTVALLQKPDALKVDPKKRTLASWDGCFLLATVLGDDKLRYEPEGTYDPLSGCYAASVDGSSQDTFKLEVQYDKWDPLGEEKTTVAGKDAAFMDYDTSCAVEWNHGPSGVGDEWFVATAMKLDAPTCEKAKELAEAAEKLIADGAFDKGAKPQRPLLYKPDESDTGTLGACANFAQGADGDCEPFRPDTQLPTGTDALLAAGSSNRHTQCAVFKDAVAEVYGTEFEPITWGAHCLFVEPTGALMITVNVDAENAPAPYGSDPNLYSDRKTTEVEGKAAVTFYNSGKTSYDVYVSPYNDISRAGNVHIGVEAWPARGVGGGTPEVDPAKLTAADEVIAKVVKQYFT
ncbi:hypothetical protein ACFQV2_38100 [Actinokineospora soli]|uniref:Uncharacterized protein n=1 Tax=Actinokineospora soli TaxID=1048753 RepID=A0ABW2TYL0_9PSEU